MLRFWSSDRRTISLINREKLAMDATLAQQEEDRLELDNEDYELRLSSKHSGKPQLERSRTQDGRSEPTQASNAPRGPSLAGSLAVGKRLGSDKRKQRRTPTDGSQKPFIVGNNHQKVQ